MWEWAVVGGLLEVLAAAIWLRPEPLIWLTDRTLGRYTAYLARHTRSFWGREMARDQIDSYKSARRNLRWIAYLPALWGLILLWHNL